MERVEARVLEGEARIRAALETRILLPGARRDTLDERVEARMLERESSMREALAATQARVSREPDEIDEVQRELNRQDDAAAVVPDGIEDVRESGRLTPVN